MGAIPDKGAFFSVRTPAWWDTAREYVLAEYPGKEKAMELADQNWDVAQRGVAIERRNADGVLCWQRVEGYVEHFRSDNGVTLRIGSDTFQRIPNRVPWEFCELLIEQGFLYETAGCMDEGRQCFLTLLLNEPITIKGDDSVTLPYVGASWAHDGSMSFSVRSTSVRQVCENTVSASEAEGKKLGTNFVFRHTKNVLERVAEAKKVIKGVRENHDVYVQAMNELAEIHVTPAQRDMFVSTIIGDKGGVVSMSATVSDRVKDNLEAERAKINACFFGPTIPEAHKLTGYGLHLAGVEYADHLRGYRSKDSYVRRTLLTDSPFKANLNRTIREIVAA